MIKRILQFYRAITARLSAEDIRQIKKHLPPAAQKLFFAMHLADQYHTFNVYKTAIALYEKMPAIERAQVDYKLLLRAALLHDVGRKNGDLNIVGKVATVLLTSFMPNFSKRIAAKKVRGILARPSYWLYIYYNHPIIGAAKLKAIGMVSEAEIVAKHHNAAEETDSIELKFLKIADEQN